MPVLHEHEMTSQAAMEAAIRALKQQRDAGQRLETRLDRTWVRVPEGHDQSLVWSRPDKVDQRKAWGAEVVDAKTAEEVYGVPAIEIDRTHNCARRLGCILMRYPAPQRLARLAVPALDHLKHVVRESDHHMFLRPDDRTGQVQDLAVTAQEYGQRRQRQRPVRPRTPVFDHALDAHGLTREDVADRAFSATDEEES